VTPQFSFGRDKEGVLEGSVSRICFASHLPV
jgi:hypothetical protein